jgi:hypothetical protein
VEVSPVSLDDPVSSNGADESTTVMSQDSETLRWFGVKIWNTWRVEDSPLEHVEETVVAVRAHNSRDAKERALKFSKKSESDFRNEDGEQVSIRISVVGAVYDTGEARLHRNGVELFSQLYELEDGLIDGGWPTG